MRNALYISGGLHLAVVLLVWLGLPELLSPRILPDQVVPVALVKDIPKDAPRLKEPEPEPKKPEEKKPEPPKAKPEPAPKLKQVPPPPPKPKESPKPKPQEKPKEKPKPKPEPKPEEKPADFNMDDLAALIDKTPDKDKPKPAPKAEKPEAKPQEQSSFSGPRMTASEIDGVRQQFYRCWNVPAGAQNARNLRVTIRINLARDGSLVGAPRLIGAMDESNPHFRTAAESAIRAVHMCTPLDLPLSKYDRWREMELTFDPSDMLQ